MQDWATWIALLKGWNSLMHNAKGLCSLSSFLPPHIPGLSADRRLADLLRRIGLPELSSDTR